MVHRRTFLKHSALASATFALSSTPVGAWAQHLADSTPGAASNRVRPLRSWTLDQLQARGQVTTYSKARNELQYLGMPVGGLHAGTVYVGGDGRLWLWDIFNRPEEGIDPKVVQWRGDRVRSRDGSAYVAPPRAHDLRPVEQGFAVRIRQGDRTWVRALREQDWPDIQFEATYPIARVHYQDPALPIDLALEAFSPFIPLDEAASSLPVTVQSFQIRNTGTESIQIDLLGWLENPVGKFTRSAGTRSNTAIADAAYSAVAMRFAAEDPARFAQQRDAGSMGIAVLGQGRVLTRLAGPVLDSQAFAATDTDTPTTVQANANTPLLGAASATRTLAPGASATVNFILGWHFPNVDVRIGAQVPDARTGHFYSTRFKDAPAAIAHTAHQFDALASTTRQWHATWYDSSLPWWLLERSMINTSALATGTSLHFATGRHWAWEGVGACEGNCTHVWQYAHAVGHLFPQMERDNRQRVDLGIAMQPNGAIWFRAEFDKRPAIDGQAGVVLRAYRDHRMSTDAAYLRRNWPKIKQASQFILAQDRNGDGMEDTPMENTLDAVWDGEIAWIVGLCIAAVQATQHMAVEMGDTAFAQRCARYVRDGSTNMSTHLFNGEYFIHRPDPAKGRKRLGSYNTCHIDQVLGQSWAFQVGMDRVIDREQTLSALRSLWKYNFQYDVGPYLDRVGHGRPYALPGEAGMVMNTNPHNEPHPYGTDVTWQAGYFHECMSGFEHQVASHMMAEGMTEEALLLTRAIHDRYHASKRNPYNEIEASDHYARAMAVYGTFLSTCGFNYHGPRGLIAFAPRWGQADFRAPFTTAAGWGTYTQQGSAQRQQHQLQLAYGTLQLRTVELELIAPREVSSAQVRVGKESVRAVAVQQEGNRLRVTFEHPITLDVDRALELVV